MNRLRITGLLLASIQNEIRRAKYILKNTVLVNRILVRISATPLLFIFARHLIIQTDSSTVSVDKYVITVNMTKYLNA